MIVLGYVCPIDLSQIKSAETYVKCILNRNTCSVVNSDKKCDCIEHNGDISPESYTFQSRIHP